MKYITMCVEAFVNVYSVLNKKDDSQFMRIFYGTVMTSVTLMGIVLFAIFFTEIFINLPKITISFSVPTAIIWVILFIFYYWTPRKRKVLEHVYRKKLIKQDKIVIMITICIYILDIILALLIRGGKS